MNLFISFSETASLAASLQILFLFWKPDSLIICSKLIIKTLLHTGWYILFIATNIFQQSLYVYILPMNILLSGLIFRDSRELIILKFGKGTNLHILILN